MKQRLFDWLQNDWDNEAWYTVFYLMAFVFAWSFDGMLAIAWVFLSLARAHKRSWEGYKYEHQE